MSFISDVLGGTAGKVIEAVGGVLDRISTTDEEKQAAKLALQRLLQERDSEVEQTLRSTIQAKERIMVAELQQGDNYTKRARPTIVYGGLLLVLVGAVAKILGMSLDVNALVPDEFWIVWGGVCGVWIIGRSAEKIGSANRAVEVITGGRAVPSILDT